VKHWIVTRIADGAIVYRYQHPEPVEWSGMEFATHTHAEEVQPEDVPPAPPEVRHITKLAFRNRFTQAEKAMIEIASLDSPVAPMQRRAQAAGLRASMKDQEVAQYIDLSRPETRAGVQQLEAAGLLAAGRAAVILDAPVAPAEVWHG
jgi:hypothetical protein